ncbi:MAG: hypothetical protein ACYSWZ_03740, partial [Planctomycetota bacterium]
MKETRFWASQKQTQYKPNFSRRSLWRRRKQTQFLSAIYVVDQSQYMLLHTTINTRPYSLGSYPCQLNAPNAYGR